MSLHSGASGASSTRGPNTIAVDLDFGIVELAGLPLADTAAYQCRWKRGHRHHGETQWVRAEEGRVRWKQSFSLPQQVMPVAGTDTAKRKFLDIQLHRATDPAGETFHRNLRVELSYQGDKRRKARIAVPFETPEGRPATHDLQITVHMREATGAAAETSSASTGGTAARSSSRGRSRDRADGTPKRSPSVAAPAAPGDPRTATPTAGADPELQTIYAGVCVPSPSASVPESPQLQGAAGVSADNMKMNVLKLYSKIQEQEGLLAEKRRECKEVRAAYGTLRADYERLRADLEGAEARVGRLKQELRRERERERGRSLEDPKARYEVSRPGGGGVPGDERRTCEAGNCLTQ